MNCQAGKRTQSPRGEVIHAAGAVRDVCHDDALRARVLLDDVRDGRGEQGQAFGHLQRHALGFERSHLKSSKI